MPVKTKLKIAMISAARFRFRSLGLAISRFTWARDSSPLIAKTEWPKAIRMPNMPKLFARSVCFRKPSASSLKCRLAGMGKGGRRVVYVELRGAAVKHGMHGSRNPAMRVGGSEELIDQAGNVLPGRDAGNR